MIQLVLNSVLSTKNKTAKRNEIVHLFFHYYRKVTVFSCIGGEKIRGAGDKVPPRSLRGLIGDGHGDHGRVRRPSETLRLERRFPIVVLLDNGSPLDPLVEVSLNQITVKRY